MFRLLFPAVLLVVGCARKRDPAPTEMVDLVRFMFANWEDDLSMQDALDNLTPWLDANVDTKEARDGFRLDPLVGSDVGTVAFPDRPLSSLLGAAGGGISEFPLADHSGHIPLTDQLFSNPTNYKAYERHLVEGTRKSFEDDLALLRTANDIETANFGVSIPYELFKDYRWVQTESGNEAIIARSWIEEQGCNDGGGNCVELSFSVDMFVASGNKTQRLTASWSEVTSALPLGDDALIAGLALGIQNVFYHTDAFLAGEQ